MNQVHGSEETEIYMCIFCCLDDLTPVLPASIAEDAVPVRQEELKAVAFTVSAAKTPC